MSFFATFYVAVCCLCTGGAAGCMFFLFTSAALYKEKPGWWLSLFCILLCFVICAVVALLLTEPHLCIDVFFLQRKSLFYCLLLFAAGALCAVRVRIVLPTFLVFYIVFTIFCISNLTTRFGYPPVIVSIAVDVSSVTINGRRYEKPVTNDGNRKLYIQYCGLSSWLLIPGPRVWYTVSGDNEGVPVQFSRKLAVALLGQVKTLSIEICAGSINAMLYTLTVTGKPENPVPLLVRVM
jgi:hypothetical protein